MESLSSVFKFFLPRPVLLPTSPNLCMIYSCGLQTEFRWPGRDPFPRALPPTNRPPPPRYTAPPPRPPHTFPDPLQQWSLGAPTNNLNFRGEAQRHLSDIMPITLGKLGFNCYFTLWTARYSFWPKDTVKNVPRPKRATKQETSETSDIWSRVKRRQNHHNWQKVRKKFQTFLFISYRLPHYIFRCLNRSRHLWSGAGLW